MIAVHPKHVGKFSPSATTEEPYRVTLAETNGTSGNMFIGVDTARGACVSVAEIRYKPEPCYLNRQERRAKASKQRKKR